MSKTLLEGSQWVKDASDLNRLRFVRKVYSILCAQLVVTVAIAAPIANLGPQWVSTQQHHEIMKLAAVVLAAAMVVMICCGDVLKIWPVNYAFLLIATLSSSVLAGFASALYTWQSLVLAAGITAGIFLGM